MLSKQNQQSPKGFFEIDIDIATAIDIEFLSAHLSV